MEFLKKSMILFAFTIMLQYANGQGTAQIAAFDSSYKLEKAAKYVDAINVIKGVYDETSYEMNLRLGWLNYLIGQQTTAMSYYEKAFKLNPFSIEARFGYVMPASVIGNWESVKEQYLEIVKIDPQNTKANYNLGLIYYNKKEYATAYKHFEKCANLYPFDYDSMLMFAWTSYFMGKTREAKVLFSKTLLIRPNDKSASEGLGLIK
jgi:tetratricopeptide (TPR) repeat protein